jgi:hypothetical protein
MLEEDPSLWRVLIHYVEQAHPKSAWSADRRLAVDNTSGAPAQSTTVKTFQKLIDRPNLHGAL